MTALEYLKSLQDLADSYSHSDPVPTANKTLDDQIDDLLPPAVHDSVVEFSRKLRQERLAEAYGSNFVDKARNRMDHWMDVMHDLTEKLRLFYSDNKIACDIPCVGVLPIGTLDAAAVRVPNSTEYLIVFNEGSFLFLYLLAKIATVVGFNPGTKGSGGKWEFRIPDECQKRFADLFLNYLLHGIPSRAEQWFLAPNLLTPLQNVTTAAEFFILAHEMRHVTSSDLTHRTPLAEFDYHGEKVQSMVTTDKQELLADVEGASVTLAALSKDMNMFMVFSGIELAICARELIKNGLRVFRSEEVPPLSIVNNSRSFELGRAITTGFGEDFLHCIHSAALTRAICQSLWDGILPTLIASRLTGCSPASPWSPVL